MDKKLRKELQEFIKDAGKGVKLIKAEERNIRKDIKNIPSDAQDPGMLVFYKNVLSELEDGFSCVIDTKKSGNRLLARRPRKCTVSEFVWFSLARSRSRKLARRIPFMEGYVGVMRELVGVLEDYQEADAFVRMIEVMRVRDELVKVARSAKGR